MLILTQHFAPEVTAGRFRVQAFADALVQAGHEVRVICPVPNHPAGVVAQGYGSQLIEDRDVGRARVTYVRIAVAREKTLRTRLSSYASYAALATVLGSFAGRPDVILASSPPLSVAAAGAMLGARYRVPFLLDVRDLWPDSALDLGELQQGALVTAARRIERGAYARAAAIATTNDGFRRRILERAPANARVDVIPNGTTKAWLEVGESNVERSSVGLPDDRYVWAYAGNIGLAHGLESAADAAELLGDEYMLLVIGDGPRRAQLEWHAAVVHSRRVELRGLMPPAAAATHLRAADCVLVSERQEQTVSAKLYDVCAIGRPVIAACRGDMRRLIEREEIALAVPHGDPQALADAVRRLRSDPERAQRLTDRARAFARRHLRERQAERLVRLLKSVVVQQ